MKTFYKWFDIFLNLLLIFSFVLGPIFFYFFSYINRGSIIGLVITILFLLSVIFGLIYIIIGFSLLIVNSKLKNIERISLGKRILLKGVIRSILAFIFFFLLSFALSFFGVSGPDTSLPKIPNQNINISSSPIPSSNSNLTPTPNQ